MLTSLMFIITILKKKDTEFDLYAQNRNSEFQTEFEDPKEN